MQGTEKIVAVFKVIKIFDYGSCIAFGNCWETKPSVFWVFIYYIDTWVIFNFFFVIWKRSFTLPDFGNLYYIHFVLNKDATFTKLQNNQLMFVCCFYFIWNKLLIFDIYIYIYIFFFSGKYGFLVSQMRW